MKTTKLIIALVTMSLTFLLLGCNRRDTQETRDMFASQRQQSQYAKAQPVPAYNWSLERDLLIQLYNLRNDKVSTHSVWRSNSGVIEGECTSMGYGLPYDTSLTNPSQTTDQDQNGYGGEVLVAIGQSEPNGIFASTNTAATWVMCLGNAGNIEPHYIETKVTVYPYPVKIDWEKNRVHKSGKSTASIKIKKGTND